MALLKFQNMFEQWANILIYFPFYSIDFLRLAGSIVTEKCTIPSSLLIDSVMCLSRIIFFTFIASYLCLTEIALFFIFAILCDALQATPKVVIQTDFCAHNLCNAHLMPALTTFQAHAFVSSFKIH